MHINITINIISHLASAIKLLKIRGKKLSKCNLKRYVRRYTYVHTCASICFETKNN